MKTSKVNSTGKPKKSTGTRQAVKSKRLTTSQYVPGEEEIREKAREIYYERIGRGEHGTPESDWLEAEELLKG